MKKQLKINKPFSGHKVGTVVSIECDVDSVPLNREWRNRVKDSKIDNCVEFVAEKKPSKKSKQSEAK